MKKIILAAILFTGIFKAVTAQTVIYSEPDRDESRNMNYEIIGKVSGNIVIYKSYRDMHFVVAYDNNMQQLNKSKLDYINETLLSEDFIQYPDFFT